MKKLMLGNEAVARGLYQAGCTFVSSYPGTPSTEITECVALYDEIYAEWAPNEKVATEAAFGACIAGVRSFSAMKHVGLNVAADLLFSASYAGVNGGFVMAVADDQGMHSSQDEQDSRHYAIAAKVPMLEPADAQECIDFVQAAYEISEAYDTPVLLRLSTRISHSQSLVELRERTIFTPKPYEKNPAKFVLVPGNAIKRHVIVEDNMAKLAQDSGKMPINKVIMGDPAIGVVASGIAYQFAKEALGDKACYFKPGLINPLPIAQIAEFARKVDKLYVIEELDPVFEQQIKAAGIAVHGGKELFSLLGEYSAAAIASKLLGKTTHSVAPAAAPVRPPVLCPGCPHRATYYTLSKLKLRVSGDIGCYTLGVMPPLASLDSTIDMGASISALHGMNQAVAEFAKQTVAVIGDSTFLHSGITGLLNMVYNQSASTVLILDNAITGMTGHQQNPSTGLTLKNTPAPAVNFEALCKGLGVTRVFTVDPYDMQAFEDLLKQELAQQTVSVIIVKRPCILLKQVKTAPALKVDRDKCKKCKMCMKIGCPAISFDAQGSHIDPSLCVGCGLCQKLCRFDCIGN